MHNPYLDLTREFNDGRLRALLSSGQAVVAHRLAIMSKDGDWILREDEDAVDRVLAVLDRHGARYRLGAPLDTRWLAGGWSSHFEFRADGMRVRTDFVARPPRVTPKELARMWCDAEASGDFVVGLEPLAALKLTDREKDYAVVGELARKMTDPRAQLRWSRSSRDIVRLAASHPEALADVARERPLLDFAAAGRDVLDEELDRERRALMRVNEERLGRYRAAAHAWAAIWPDVSREAQHMSLGDAHRLVTRRAEGVLPFAPAIEATP